MKILVCDAYAPEALAWLRATLETTDIQHCPQPHSESAKIQDTDALLIRSGTKVNEKLLSRLPQLKVIVTATSGFDHIDLEACRKRQIAVISTPDANRDSAAELTLWLMLTAVRKLAHMPGVIASGRWREGLRRGHLLKGKTLGIFGLGRIGSRVCELARGFDLKVLAYDPYISDERFVQFGAEKTGMSELLRLSDIVSLHVPLTKDTHHIIAAPTIELMPSHGIVVNTSRGAVVDENTLIQALLEGHLAGAALDVFESEPLSPQSRLLSLPQVVCTPHIGAYTEEAFSIASRLAVERLVSFLKNGETDQDLTWTTHPVCI